MAKLSKNRKDAISKVNLDSEYTTLEAAQKVKETSTEKFDASVDIAVKLGVDPKQANLMVRGVVALPHGTGKQLKVLALVTADKEEEAKTAGADKPPPTTEQNAKRVLGIIRELVKKDEL